MRTHVLVLATMVSVIHALSSKSCQVVNFANSPRCRQQLSLKLCVVAGSSPTLLLGYYGSSLYDGWMGNCEAYHQATCPASTIKTGFCTGGNDQWCYHYTSAIEQSSGCETDADCTDAGFRVAGPRMPCCDFLEEVSPCSQTPPATCSNEPSCFKGTRDTLAPPAPTYQARSTPRFSTTSTTLNILIVLLFVIGGLVSMCAG
jgi:hypothetical protein